MAYLELKGISKRFGDVEALSPLDLTQEAAIDLAHRVKHWATNRTHLVHE